MADILPNHIGIIMDGNRRWAIEHGLPKTAGHKEGAKTLKNLLMHANQRGIKTITLYAFSSENWGRSLEEVDTLMQLLRQYLQGDIARLHEKNIRVSFIGQRERFAADILEKMNALEEESAKNTGLHVVLALSYSAREDILQAVQKLAEKVKQGVLDPALIHQEDIAQALSTHDLPPPDFIIRTSGEQRLSNFLLWESAYAELYFPQVFWPDFTPEQFDKALDVYASRQRRYGK